MRDMKNNLKIERVLSPAAAITGNTAQVGQIIDHQGFDSATYEIFCGEFADAGATVTPLLEESDDGVNFTAVADANLVGTEAGETFDQDDDDKIKTLGYIGTSRYTRLTLTPASNAGNLFLAASCVQTKAHRAAVTQD